MIIGIDLGGTKTHVIAEVDGRVILDVAVPTESWQRGGLLDDPATIVRLLGLFAQLDDSRTAALAIGAHGLDSERQVLAFGRALRSLHDGPVEAINDVELLAPAAGLDHAIAIVAGTGSKVVGRDVNGEVVSAGGHGFLLSDPGSAASLARDAVRAVLDAHDRGDAPDPLGLALLQRYGVDDVIALNSTFGSDVRLTTWGALAPLVFTAADTGSELAAAVIDDAARDLARQVGRVHARGAIGAHVVCAGGVITNQPRLYRSVAHHIDDLGLGLDVSLLSVAPVVGAVALARRLQATPAPHAGH